MRLTGFLIGFICTSACLAQGPINPEHKKNIEFFLQYFIEDANETFSESNISNQWKNWKTVENYSFGKDRGNLSMIADLDALHPYFRKKIATLIEKCKDKGIELAVVESFRTHAKQNEYKSMGKNYTRSSGGSSKHQYGLAVDVVPIIDSVAQWDNTKLWKKVGLIGESLGLRWGGRWKSLYDPGHFEWTGGLTGTQLASGLLPKIPNQNEFPCLDEDLLNLVQQWQAWELEQAVMVRKNSSAVGLK